MSVYKINTDGRQTKNPFCVRYYIVLQQSDRKMFETYQILLGVFLPTVVTVCCISVILIPLYKYILLCVIIACLSWQDLLTPAWQCCSSCVYVPVQTDKHTQQDKQLCLQQFPVLKQYLVYFYFYVCFLFKKTLRSNLGRSVTCLLFYSCVRRSSHPDGNLQ